MVVYLAGCLPAPNQAFLSEGYQMSARLPLLWATITLKTTNNLWFHKITLKSLQVLGAVTLAAVACKLVSLSKVHATTRANRIHICLLGQIKLIIAMCLLVSKRNATSSRTTVVWLQTFRTCCNLHYCMESILASPNVGSSTSVQI